jgi:hypothetical protein
VQIDPVKVAWIIRQKENGVRNSVIAGAMKVSVRRVQKIYSLYRATEAIPELKRPGRKSIEPSQDEMDLITNAYNEHRTGALIIERIIDVVYSKHIPHNRIHKVTKSMGIARSGRSGSNTRENTQTRSGTQTGSLSMAWDGSPLIWMMLHAT